MKDEVEDHGKCESYEMWDKHLNIAAWTLLAVVWVIIIFTERYGAAFFIALLSGVMVWLRRRNLRNHLHYHFDQDIDKAKELFKEKIEEDKRNNHDK